MIGDDAGELRHRGVEQLLIGELDISPRFVVAAEGFFVQRAPVARVADKRLLREQLIDDL